MALSSAACDAHPDRRAGWRCEACGGALCPACTGQRKAGNAFLDVCARCEGLAAPIRERRALLQPFDRSLLPALRWPFQGRGPAALLFWGIVITILGYIGGGGTIARALFVGWLFHVARTTTVGHDEIPTAADFRGYFEDIVAPMTRLALGTVWFWAPFVLLRWGRGTPAHPAIVLVVCATGLTIVPISLIASAVETPLVQILNPLVLARYALRLGRDYRLLLAFTVGCFLIEVALLAAGARWAVHPLATTLVRVLSLAPPLAFFRAVGLLLRARGDDLGYGRAEDYLARVLGDAQPEAGWRENQVGTAHGEDRRGAPGDPSLFSGEAARFPSPENSPRALEFDGGDAPSTASAPLELVRRLRAQDTDGALEVLEQSGKDIAALTLSADGWLGLARAGAAQKRIRPALVAAKRAIEVAPEGPAAPRAWLLAARLYDEGLQNRAESDRLLGELVRRFPESAEAAFAHRRLKP